MKSLLFSFLIVALCPVVAPGQGGCAGLIEQTRKLIRNFDFDGATIKLNAAKGCAGQEEIDKLEAEMRLGLKKQAADAENAKRKAEKEKENALHEKLKADSLLLIADSLAQKGRELERTFSESSAYIYLYATGLKHFEFDTVAQRRDYFNAKTYFAMARFFNRGERNPTLDNMIRAAQAGIEADAFFMAGKLDSAGQRYLEIKSLIKDAAYETERLAHIREVRTLFDALLQQYRENPGASLVLDGNWWTLPEQFGSLAGIRDVAFRNNRANWKKFPEALLNLNELQTIRITNCPNIRDLSDWNGLSQLRSIVLSGNLNLYALGGLDSLEHLTILEIDACPALTTIEGCRRLETFSIRGCPQARVKNLLLQNGGMKRLSLADIPENNFDIDNLINLETLNLSNMKDTSLTGFEKNRRLQVLRIDNLDNLKQFVLPDTLRDVGIYNCDNIENLNNWPASNNLQKVVFFNNARLKNLPRWQYFPGIKKLLIQNNNRLPKAGKVRLLKNADEILILNNRKSETWTVVGGISVDFNKIDGGKLEVEWRKGLGDHAIGIKLAFPCLQNRLSVSGSKRDYKLFAPHVGLTYYSPYYVYYGGGFGIADLKLYGEGEYLDRTLRFTWINSLGGYFTPNSLKRDKIKIFLDVYTVFRPGSAFLSKYNVFFAVGLSYCHTPRFGKKAYVVLPNDNKKYIKKKRVERLWEDF